MAVGSLMTFVNFDSGLDDPKQAFPELKINADIYNTLINTLLKALAEADAGDGLLITAGVAAVDLAADPGLEFATAKLRAKIAATNPGLVRNANGLAALVAAARGVKITASGLGIDIPGLTEDTSPDLAADFIPIYDTSGTVIKKVKPENIGSPAGLTLIDSKTISGSPSTIDFTTGIDSTYLMYEIQFLNVQPSAVAQLGFRVRTGGSTWQTANYAWHVVKDGTGTSNGSDSVIKIHGAVDGLANDNTAGWIRIFNPSLATAGTRMNWFYSADGAVDSCLGGGGWEADTAVDGFRFLWDAAETFAGGEMRLYGYKKV